MNGSSTRTTTLSRESRFSTSRLRRASCREGGSPSASSDARSPASSGQRNCSRSMRTSTSESSPSSWAASSTAETAAPSTPLLPVQEPAVDHQGHQEQIAHQGIHAIAQGEQVRRTNQVNPESRKPGHAQHRVQANPHTEGRLPQRGRRLAPLRQVHRVHAGARLLGHDGEFLAQIHALAQFVHRRMARAHRFGQRRAISATAPAGPRRSACAPCTAIRTRCPCRTGPDPPRRDARPRYSGRPVRRCRPSCRPAAPAPFRRSAPPAAAVPVPSAASRGPPPEARTPRWESAPRESRRRPAPVPARREPRRTPPSPVCRDPACGDAVPGARSRRAVRPGAVYRGYEGPES